MNEGGMTAPSDEDDVSSSGTIIHQKMNETTTRTQMIDNKIGQYLKKMHVA